MLVRPPYFVLHENNPTIQLNVHKVEFIANSFIVLLKRDAKWRLHIP